MMSSSYRSPVSVIYLALLARVLFRWSCNCCEFPPFLQTPKNTGTTTETGAGTGSKNLTQPETDEYRKKRHVVGGWRWHIREQNTEHEFKISVDKDLIRFTDPGDGTVRRSMRCLMVLNGDRFLVGQTDDQGPGKNFLCVQFLRRSPIVVQIRFSATRNRLNVTLCLDQSLVLDPWVVVDEAGLARAEGGPCSLTGGFSVRVYDRRSKLRVCGDGLRGEIRIESDCFQGDGIQLNFRHPSCVPEGLYMYAEQRVLCATSWTQGPYAYTLLRHDRLDYMWILRSPVLLEASATAYLLTDLVTEVVETSGRDYYFRLDVVRDVPFPVTSLCVDDGDVCSVWRDPCKSGPEMTLRCPRTCNVCNATRPTVCRFPAEVSGDWDGGTEGLNRMYVEIDATTMTVASDHVVERFYCIRWESEEEERKVVGRVLSDHLLVSEFKDGCRPRYTCARILRRSPSVIFFRLSQSRSWPLTSSPLQPIDCRHFNFPDKVDAGHFRSRNFRLLYAKTRHAAVHCHLPDEEKDYHVTFRNGSQCVGRLTEAETGTQFRLTITGCPVNRTITHSTSSYYHECLESSMVLLPSEYLIVTGSMLPGVRHSAAIFCWFFLTDPRRSIYLVDAADCDESTMRRLLENRFVPLAAFVRFRRPEPSRYPHDVSNRADVSGSIVSDDNRGAKDFEDGENVTEIWSYKRTRGRDDGGKFPLGQIFAPPNAFVLAIAGLLIALIQCAYFCAH